MHNLDSVGRIDPSSLEVSRTASCRHEHVSALDHSHGTTSWARPSWWPRSWIASVTSVRGPSIRPTRMA